MSTTVATHDTIGMLLNLSEVADSMVTKARQSSIFTQVEQRENIIPRRNRKELAQYSVAEIEAAIKAAFVAYPDVNKSNLAVRVNLRAGRYYVAVFLK